MSENNPNNATVGRDALSSLTVKELKQRCKDQGIKVSGTKNELVARLLDPAAVHANRARASGAGGGRSMTTTQVHAALKSLGYSNPESASSCVKRSIQRGFLSLDGGLTKVIYQGQCENCGEDVSCTLEDLLGQPDYAGLDYEDGGQNGAVQCEGSCDGMYLTGVCEGKLELDSGKFHNHCTECPGFGKCLGDYREAHCHDCGKHYFAGLSGFPCQCRGGGDWGDY